MTHLIEKCKCGAVLDISSTLWGEAAYAHKRSIESHEVCRQGDNEIVCKCCGERLQPEKEKKKNGKYANNR